MLGQVEKALADQLKPVSPPSSWPVGGCRGLFGRSLVLLAGLLLVAAVSITDSADAPSAAAHSDADATSSLT
ncbi:hypothetical protein LCGC14_2266040, partial [marine sediment metagenome]